MVVGADGASSPLRAQVLPGHEPLDTGSAALYGRTPLIADGRPVMPPALGKSGVLAIGDEPGHAAFFTAMRFGESPAGAFARLAPGHQAPSAGSSEPATSLPAGTPPTVAGSSSRRSRAS